MAAVTSFVVDEADVEPVRKDGAPSRARLTFSVEHLEPRTLRFSAGPSRARTAGSRHELLYVVSGSGELELEGERHELEPGTAAFVAPGESWSVENHRSEELLLVAVSAIADLPVDETRRKRIVRFDDQPEHTASVERTFRYLVNEDAGCLDVTQFIGIVQPSKAPFHSHTYDEVGYIVEGEGFAHMTEGWLLFLVNFNAENRAELRVVDAMDVAGPPVARVLLPFNQPSAFHGCFVAA